MGNDKRIADRPLMASMDDIYEALTILTLLRLCGAEIKPGETVAPDVGNQVTEKLFAEVVKTAADYSGGNKDFEALAIGVFSLKVKGIVTKMTSLLKDAATS